GGCHEPCSYALPVAIRADRLIAGCLITSAGPLRLLLSISKYLQIGSTRIGVRFILASKLDCIFAARFAVVTCERFGLCRTIAVAELAVLAIGFSDALAQSRCMVCKPAGGRAANRFRRSGDLLNPGKNFKTRRLEEDEWKSRGAGGLPRRGLGYEIVTVYRDQGVSGVKISRWSGRPPTRIDFFVLLTAPIPLPHGIAHKPLRCSPPRVRRKLPRPPG